MFGIVYLPIFRYSNISVWLILCSSIKSFNIIIFPHRLSVIVNKKFLFNLQIFFRFDQFLFRCRDRFILRL